ncbi:Signal transduction histidine kinase [Asanoa ishikariensis]|uniref:histidine kinase n=1 Tax=Asanoa ishikariensis TaxID=137265 RepID=A0A1H3UZ91_9ACTN|nr:Signal transduction histidine kinase [Asanoa ishikariensis]
MRLRTTAVAVLVVAVALLLGALALVALMRASLRDGLEATAEQRATGLAEQIAVSGLPAAGPADDEVDDLVWQVASTDGTVLRASQPLREPLPTEDRRSATIEGADDRYLVVSSDAQDYVVSVAVSLEEVADSTAALVTPLVVGVPALLLLVGGTVWVVAGRALAPIERIRREVEEITGDRLDRRVPEPRSRDEVHRMARTMNQMLGRLEDARDRQQRFVADASHELRSPLASIRQAAEVARDHPGALPEGDLADAVLEESARMQRLVSQLLLLTRGVAAAPHDVDLDDLALAEARRVARTGLEVDTAGVGAGRVRGDPTALGQVVRNLVDNAARHAEGQVAVAVRSAGGSVELVVEDDGLGVPVPARERVFERFVRLDEARTRDAGGSGLGLAIVKEIVTAHGGTVAVSSSALGGARFVVRLPS